MRSRADNAARVCADGVLLRLLIDEEPLAVVGLARLAMSGRICLSHGAMTMRTEDPLHAPPRRPATARLGQGLAGVRESGQARVDVLQHV